MNHHCNMDNLYCNINKKVKIKYGKINKFFKEKKAFVCNFFSSNIEYVTFVNLS